MNRLKQDKIRKQKVIKLSHLDSQGKVKMVDVSEKKNTTRIAVAKAEILVKSSTLKMITDNKIPKGNVFTTAEIAGITAAKKTSDLIPLCHPLLISNIDVDFSVDKEKSRILVKSEVKLEGKTGAEMEALIAVSIAALTIYDMCKSVDREMIISDIKLLRKRGGESGEYIWQGKNKR